jgi:DNA polymerase III delta subunit
MASKQPFRAFIVSFGGEQFFLDSDIERARSWKGRTVVQVDGEGMTDARLVSLFEEVPYDESQRVVIVDYADKIKGDKRLKAYVENRNLADESTVVVAIVRSEKLPEVWAMAARKGKLYEYKKLKTYESNNEVVKWIEAEARNLQIVLSKGTSTTLYQLVGPDLHKLSNELRKLALLVGPHGQVGVEQLDLAVSPSPTAEPFQVAEAAMAKDARKAMNTLSIVYKTMGEDAHVPITFAMIKQIEKVVAARDLLDRKMSEEDIAGAIGMNAWLCKTMFLPMVQKHRMSDLIQHMSRLRKLDADVKGSARSKRTLVELAVLSVAR